jgi:transposase
LDDVQRQALRQSKALPVLDGLREWLDLHLSVVVKQSSLGKAMHYMDKQWPRLTVYTKDGRLHIDNNLCENAIRPFVIGRKNSLFSDTVSGAKASANLYSLIETAKANGLEPYAYLKKVFTELPKATCVEDIEALLPFKQQLAEEKAA